ncbi:uracil-DNA glycosylase [Methyloferula stellata]|uniref:uracil-DNA glycosylase n=1 Tax=Methyloferula stellata TaxID=876270 RepID=UPI00036F9842|nr:uracil-DNA glycosylase [Methyloferula stellata]
MSSSDTITPEALASLLRWYADMGVDMAVDEAPHDRFAEALAGKPSPAAASASDAPTARSLNRDAATAGMSAPRTLSRTRADTQALKPEAASADALAQSAREAAASAQTLEELRARLDAFQGCALKNTATQLVFSDGNPQADIMFVGEAPGADEDRIGRPFVGRAGQLLDKMLASIGLDRTKVYIANVVPWRPPGNRTPTPVETAACLPFTHRQIELADPKILVCVGLPSAQTLLNVTEGIKRARGKWMSYEVAPGRTIPAMAMLHPAYLLRTPADKKLAWQDLRMIAKELAKLG